MSGKKRNRTENNDGGGRLEGADRHRGRKLRERERKGGEITATSPPQVGTRTFQKKRIEMQTQKE
jgi:hypothetical protein